MYFASNLKFLRKRKKLTQDEISSALEIKRSTLNNYENEISWPSIPALISLSDYFQVAVDTLLRTDLSQLRDSQLHQLEHGQDVYVKGSQLRVLATTVDRQNRDNIELVSEKAKAGYLNGFSDPEYISELPVFQLPFLSREKKYRTFQISGDSMLPIPDGAWITGEFVQDWNDIKDGERYVVLTLNDGLVFKQVKNELKPRECLHLISTNPDFEPYDLPIAEIMEVWKFIHYIATEVPEPSSLYNVEKSLESLKKEMAAIREKLR
jgi:transcriptional regulator with XRE-family HTH domain